MDKSRKEEYFVMARKADAEHKMKYPGRNFLKMPKRQYDSGLDLIYLIEKIDLYIAKYDLLQCYLVYG